MSAIGLTWPARCAALPFTLLSALLSAACERESQAEEVPLPSLVAVEPDVVEAITAAREAVLLEPESGKAWGRLGDRYSVHDFTTHAVACYAKANELDPESFLWGYRLGCCLVDDQPAQAAIHLERSLRSLDKHAPAHEVYAHVLARLGRTDEALAHYARASELDPSDAGAETGSGLLYLQRGDLDAARRHLEEALARDSRHAEAHIGLAQVYQAQGLEKKARQHAELSRTLPQASRQLDEFALPNLPPAGARARSQLARQLERQGQHEQAAEQYRLALRSNPSYYAARVGLAKLLDKQGRQEEAIELLREAERLNPSFEQPRRDIAKLQHSAELEPQGEGEE